MILLKDDLAKQLWDKGFRGSEENLEEVLKTEYGRSDTDIIFVKRWLTEQHETRCRLLQRPTLVEKRIDGVKLGIRRITEFKSRYGRWEITGCTYPLRDKLKSAGFEWDAMYKCWYTDDFETAKFFL